MSLDKHNRQAIEIAQSLLQKAGVHPGQTFLDVGCSPFPTRAHIQATAIQNGLVKTFFRQRLLDYNLGWQK